MYYFEWFDNHLIFLDRLEDNNIPVEDERVDLKRARQEFQNILDTMNPDDYIPFNEVKNER